MTISEEILQYLHNLNVKLELIGEGIAWDQIYMPNEDYSKVVPRPQRKFWEHNKPSVMGVF